MIVDEDAVIGGRCSRGWAAISLPFLDAMMPAFAQGLSPAPVRLAWFYVPNGIDMRHWTPAAEGPLGTLPEILAPLSPLKNDILVLSNLTANWGRPLLDGAGDHGRAAAAYMTGMYVYKTAGADIKLGVSADQVAAKAIGDRPGCHRSRLVSRKRVRRATATTATPARMPTTSRGRRRPSHCRRSPIRAICSSGSSARTGPNRRSAYARRLSMRRSILDTVIGATRRLESDLGGIRYREDGRVLTSVREIEQQVQRAEREGKVLDPGIDKPFGVPIDFARLLPVDDRHDAGRVQGGHHAHLDDDDRPRGSVRPYPEIGVADGHHPLTHHQGNSRCSTRCARSTCCTPRSSPGSCRR